MARRCLLSSAQCSKKAGAIHMIVKQLTVAHPLHNIYVQQSKQNPLNKYEINVRQFYNY